MALGNGFNFDSIDATDVGVAQATAPATTNTGKKAASKEKMAQFQKLGAEVVASMSAEEQAKAKSKKDTLIFKGFAVLQSKLTDSIVRGKKEDGTPNRVPVPKSVGLVFCSTEPISVPLIDVKYDFKVVVPDDQRSERTIEAGKDFILTKLEAMMLLARTEYSGYFTTENNGDGNMNVNTAKYGENAYPTPTFNLDNGGSHDLSISIDRQDENGNWVINDDAEASRFAPFLVKKPATRAAGSGATKEKTDKTVLVAAALRKVLGIN